MIITGDSQAAFQAPAHRRVTTILTPESFAFLAELHRPFDAWRRELLEKHEKRWHFVRFVE